MSEIKIPDCQYKVEPVLVNNLENEIDMLLLAMLCVFTFELTINQLAKNIRNLFIQLDIPIQRRLLSKVRLSIASLLSNDLIIHQKNGYVISDKGKPLGFHTLSLFRQNVTDSKN